MIKLESKESRIVSDPVQEKVLRIQLEKAASLVFSDSVFVDELVVECKEEASLTFQTTSQIEKAYILCGARSVVLNMSVLAQVCVKGGASCTALIHVARRTAVYIEGDIQIHLRSIQAAMVIPKTWFQSQCVFCMEAQGTRIALPCRHSAWCAGCEPSVVGTKFERQCSVCMSPVRSLSIQ